jgi:non-ribosomal peptide synthetase component E (peptide arylation enzyme)
MGFKNQLRAGVVFIDEIPKLGVGKIDRNYFKNLISNEVINK